MKNRVKLTVGPDIPSGYSLLTHRAGPGWLVVVMPKDPESRHHVIQPSIASGTGQPGGHGLARA